MVRQNLSNKDILKLLEAAKDKPKENKDLESVKKFIIDNNIKDGKDKIPNYLIYYTYYNYCNKPLSRTTFFIYFKTFFKREKTRTERFYLLDKSVFDLSIETKFKARALTRKENEKKKKKG